MPTGFRRGQKTEVIVRAPREPVRRLRKLKLTRVVGLVNQSGKCYRADQSRNKTAANGAMQLCFHILGNGLELTCNGGSFGEISLKKRCHLAIFVSPPT